MAGAAGEKATYVNNRGVDRQHYQGIVHVFLSKFPNSTKAELERVLLDKMPAILTEAQKRNRVRNLLQEMRREGVIVPNKRGPKASWRLASQR